MSTFRRGWPAGDGGERGRGRSGRRVSCGAPHPPAAKAAAFGSSAGLRVVRAAGRASDGGGDRPAEAIVGAPMPWLPFYDFANRVVNLSEMAQRGLVLYTHLGWELADDDGRRREEDLRHASYDDLRHRFAEVAPGVAIAAISVSSEMARYMEAERLGWHSDGSERRAAHYLLADCSMRLGAALGLPVRGRRPRCFYEPIVLVATGGRVRKVFTQPVAGRDAEQALAWLQLH